MLAKKKLKRQFAVSGSMDENSRFQELERVRSKIAAHGVTEWDIAEACAGREAASGNSQR